MKRCILLFLLTSFSISCKKDIAQLGEQSGSGLKKLAPDGFNFETSKKVDISIKILSNIDEPIKGVIVDVNNTEGETLFRGVTDAQGMLLGSANIPAYLDTLQIRPDNPGLTQNIQVLTINKKINCVIGGSDGGSGYIKLSDKSARAFSGASVFAGTTYTYMGTYDAFGRPLNYLDPTKGTVSANLLTYLAESLPEQKDVRTHHPQYLSDQATKHLNIVKTSDVWITYVSEGALFKNAVGYYTYPTNTPPNQVHKIENVKYVFPNTSGSGSGGSMQPGDRVNIGRFNAGTSIGFVLLQDGWKQNINTVSTSGLKFYSDSKFNPEPSDALKTHTVLLNFAQENLFVIGFEDIKRDLTGCDQDFNDVILYATSQPTDGISTVGVQGMAPPKDTDGDGVWDVNDKFPTDANKAFITYFPSAETKGTLVFEDNWPNKGDYDMNDLVINYQYRYISNSSNKVVEMIASYRALAAWAFNENGFGVQFPFSSSLISSVSGNKITGNYINFNSNGTEAGQSKAVIIPFDNHKNLLFGPAGIIDSAVLNITFASPQDFATIGTGPYNPFLICNKIRGVEAHLPGQLPTDKANTALFGTGHDKSNPGANKYYLSAENWPWALNFTEHFYYPSEGNAIDITYLHFGEWASSGGTLFTDWYKNTAPGYRDQLKIQ